MHDLIGLTFAVINLVLGFFIMFLVFRAMQYYKTGILMRTFRRAWVPAVAVGLFFFVELLVAVDVLPSNTPIDDILGTIFMLGFLYVARGFINDWKKLGIEE